MEEHDKPPKAGCLKLWWIAIGMFGFTAVAVVLYLGASKESRDDKQGVIQTSNEMKSLLIVLEAYRIDFGEFPPGDSHAICRALTGDNPQNRRYIEWKPANVDEAGNFLDPWGTPYRFYFSGETPLIRFAGENRQFDEDDKFSE